MNAELQRTARRDKKAFLSVQFKEIEENNRMGKTRDLFKKIRDTKGTFHAKTGSIKDRNGVDPTEAEDFHIPPPCIPNTLRHKSSPPAIQVKPQFLQVHSPLLLCTITHLVF